MEDPAPRILIVDDDLDFASLLSDVFAQASYEVETLGDPAKAEALLRSTPFSLVVTDLRMPGIDGLELSRKIKSIQPEVPVIIVSGFLDGKERERLENEGIVALYEKPLSVFSLLKNAARLIAEGKNRADAKGTPEETGETKGGLGFSFRALPCESDASRAFAESLFRSRHRRNNLCVIAPPGTPTRAILADFCEWNDAAETGARIVESKECNEESLGTFVDEAAAAGQGSLVLCVLEVDRLDPSQQRQLAKASRKGAFRSRWDGFLRFVFVIRSDVESLYQEGALGDELYLTMGGSEITVPTLSECPEDLEAIARASSGSDGNPLRWDDEAIRALKERDWPGNHAELQKVLVRVHQEAEAGHVTAATVLAATAEEESPSTTRRQTARKSLRELLAECRDSYLGAADRLLAGDAEAVAKLADTPVRLVERSLGRGGGEEPEKETPPPKTRTRRRKRAKTT